MRCRRRELIVRPVLCVAVLLAGCGQAHGLSTALGVTEVGRFTWEQDDPDFGGMSGLEISDDGLRFTALSDRGTLWTGDIMRNGQVITGLTTTQKVHLKAANGLPVTENLADSEGLAVAPDGTIYVSFEGDTRVAAYATATAPASDLPRAGEFRGLPGNGALEALAIGPDGALYTMPERAGQPMQAFPVFRYRDGRWTVPFRISRIDAFVPVGADIGPDGMLYILERDFTGVGFRSRVRRFDLNGAGDVVLLESGSGEYDNLEGISVWRDADDAIRMTMIADDNFKFFQRTELIEFRIED